MKKSTFILLIISLLIAVMPAAGRGSQTPEIKPVVNRDYLPVVLEMIEGARDSIDFIQLEFHYDPTIKKIQDALRAAVKRGVTVRGILEDKIYFNPRSNEFLTRFGIDSNLDTPKKATHNKTFIVDSEEVLLGSTNLSGNSIDNNNETNIYVKDRRLGEYFTAYFEKLRADSFAEPEMDAVEIEGIRTVINRQHFDALIGIIEGAEKKIRVLVYGMKYYDEDKYPDSRTNRLIDGLIAAEKRGVDVRVILDKSDYNKILNKINEATKKYLEKGGVEVRYDPEETTTHAKLVIADGEAMVGSANWGYLALEKRNESSLIVSNPATVAFFEEYFNRIWEADAAQPETDVFGENEEKPADSVADGGDVGRF